MIRAVPAAAPGAVAEVPPFTCHTQLPALSHVGMGPRLAGFATNATSGTIRLVPLMGRSCCHLGRGMRLVRPPPPPKPFSPQAI